MANDNTRYIITAFDTILVTFLVWTNGGEGFSKEKILNLYQLYMQDKYLTNNKVTKIVTVTEQKIYTFDNE